MKKIKLNHCYVCYDNINIKYTNLSIFYINDNYNY